MNVKITQVVFERVTGNAAESVITREEFDALMGAYAINGVRIGTVWVYGPDDVGGQLITLSDAKGHVSYLWYVEQFVSTYAAGV